MNMQRDQGLSQLRLFVEVVDVEAVLHKVDVHVGRVEQVVHDSMVSETWPINRYVCVICVSSNMTCMCLANMRRLQRGVGGEQHGRRVGERLLVRHEERG